MIGLCQLLNHQPQHAHAELGYMLNRRYWGQGYATEATRSVVDFALTQMKLHRIEASVLATNLASIQILVKLGMRYEGCKRENRRGEIGFTDLHIYGMLDHERM